MHFGTWALACLLLLVAVSLLATTQQPSGCTPGWGPFAAGRDAGWALGLSTRGGKMCVDCCAHTASSVSGKHSHLLACACQGVLCAHTQLHARWGSKQDRAVLQGAGCCSTLVSVADSWSALAARLFGYGFCTLCCCTYVVRMRGVLCTLFACSGAPALATLIWAMHSAAC